MGGDKSCNIIIFIRLKLNSNIGSNVLVKLSNICTIMFSVRCDSVQFDSILFYFQALYLLTYKRIFFMNLILAEEIFSFSLTGFSLWFFSSLVLLISICISVVYLSPLSILFSPCSSVLAFPFS